MKEIATKALNSTKAAIADITKSLQGIGEAITPEKIGGIILTLYLLAMAGANMVMMPYLATWLIIILPILIMLLSAAAVMASTHPRWEAIWDFVTVICQGTIIVAALVANMLPILFFYSVPMYMLHRLTQVTIENRTAEIASRLNTVAFQEA